MIMTRKGTGISLDKMIQGLGVIAALCIAAIMVLTTSDVLLRYLANSPVKVNEMNTCLLNSPVSSNVPIAP